MVKQKFPGLNVANDKRSLGSWKKIYTKFLDSNLFDLPDLYARANFSASQKRKEVPAEKRAINARSLIYFLITTTGSFHQ